MRQRKAIITISAVGAKYFSLQDVKPRIPEVITFKFGRAYMQPDTFFLLLPAILIVF
jgi:hypothetical protein